MSNVMLQLDQYCDALMEQEERAQLQAGFAYLNECLEIAGNLAATCELCRRGPLTKEMFVYLNQDDQLNHAVGTTLVWSDAKASQITYICLEGLGSGLKKVWDKIVAVFKWMGEIIAKLFKRKKNVVAEATKKVEETKKTLEELRKEGAELMKGSIVHTIGPEDLKKLRDAVTELCKAENMSKFEKDVDDAFKLEVEFLKETTNATTQPSEDLRKKIEMARDEATAYRDRIKKLHGSATAQDTRGKHSLDNRWIKEYAADQEAAKKYLSWNANLVGHMGSGIADLNERLRTMPEPAKEKAVSAKAALQSISACFGHTFAALNIASGIAQEYINRSTELVKKISSSTNAAPAP